MSGKTTAFVAGVLLASMFWIVLAQQSYCAGFVNLDSDYPPWRCSPACNQPTRGRGRLS
jgi:hypothetical protein